MAEPPVHPDPTTSPSVTDHPDNDPTYRSNVNWGSVKVVAGSGIRIVYGGPYYGRDPVNGPEQGIGIWKRQSPSFRSWDGLLELPLHLIVTRWVLSGVTFGLRLPVMGMPPREPFGMLMNEARHGVQPFSDWFSYANVIPARLFADFVNIDPKTATMELSGAWRDYNFSTASPQEDMERETVSEQDKSLDNLYYIQLLRNELPSYHFWSYTDPFQNGGQMRHGLISKGASACYDIEGDDMISNVDINFNRMQNLPLRHKDPTESEQITNIGPGRVPKEGRGRSRLPRPRGGQTLYRTRCDDDLPGRRNLTKRRLRTVQDKSYRPQREEGEEPQEVKLNKRKKKKVNEDQPYKPESTTRRKKSFSSSD